MTSNSYSSIFQPLNQIKSTSTQSFSNFERLHVSTPNCRNFNKNNQLSNYNTFEHKTSQEKNYNRESEIDQMKSEELFDRQLAFGQTRSTPNSDYLSRQSQLMPKQAPNFQTNGMNSSVLNGISSAISSIINANEIQPCWDWLGNRCQRGNLCKYGHTGQPINKQPQQLSTMFFNTTNFSFRNIQICHQWVKLGKCQYGVQCKFLHISPLIAQPTMASLQVQQLQQQQLLPNYSNNNNNNSNNINNSTLFRQSSDPSSIFRLSNDSTPCAFLNSPLTLTHLQNLQNVKIYSSPNATVEICRFFAKNGRCKYGNTCKFEHILAIRDQPTMNGHQHQSNILNNPYQNKECLPAELNPITQQYNQERQTTAKMPISELITIREWPTPLSITATTVQSKSELGHKLSPSNSLTSKLESPSTLSSSTLDSRKDSKIFTEDDLDIFGNEIRLKHIADNILTEPLSSLSTDGKAFFLLGDIKRYIPKNEWRICNHELAGLTMKTDNEEKKETDSSPPSYYNASLSDKMASAAPNCASTLFGRKAISPILNSSTWQGETVW